MYAIRRCHSKAKWHHQNIVSIIASKIDSCMPHCSKAGSESIPRQSAALPLHRHSDYSRIWWQGTLGRIPFSLQQYFGLLIRPNPVSSWNINRTVFPPWSTFSSWTVVLIFLRPLFVLAGLLWVPASGHYFAPSIPVQHTINLPSADGMIYGTLICFRNLTDLYQFPFFSTRLERCEIIRFSL